MTLDPRHPRPQLQRAGWTDLSGPWSFAHDDADVGMAERWFEGDDPFTRTIQVPFPPESPASGIGDTGLHPVLWYRRGFDVAAADRPARLLLHFGAVDYRANVWVNGRHAVTHEGGQTPFSADIAPLLVPGPTQVVTVRAHDDPADLGQPRGKQYWEVEPALIWYHRTSGIWQSVWLEALGRCAIVDLGWTPDLDAFSVGLAVRLDRAAPPGSRIAVRMRAGKIGEAGGAGDLLVDDSFAVSGVELRRGIGLEANLAGRRKRNLLWSPRTPNLVDATVELVGPDGAVLDSVQTYFGMRSVEVRDGRFHLNGQPVFMRLVLAQNYWPQSHLAAPDDDALRREVEAAKALGFNGLRIHQKIEDPRMLGWCDRLGMMVWAEAANAYRFDAHAAERLTRDWMEAVRRDRGHPCVVAWVPLNESWGVPNLDRAPEQRAFVRGLSNLTKALDPTRPVIANDGWQHLGGDMLGVHDYAPDPQVLAERYGSRDRIARTFREVRPHHAPLLSDGHELSDEAVVLSEFGGLSFSPAAGADWFGYDKLADADALLHRYGALVGALLDSTALAGFCYTQLADTMQETNGLLNADRSSKLDVAAVRAINMRASAAVPSEALENLIHDDAERRRREIAAAQGSSA